MQADSAARKLDLAEQLMGGTVDEIAAAQNAAHEPLDEFMLRMEGVKAPNSIKRIAWATGKTIQEVVDDLSR